MSREYYSDVEDYWYEGLRLAEQYTDLNRPADVKPARTTMREYVEHLKSIMKDR